MPDLIIPACGFCVGTKSETDDGIKRVTSLGGTQRGWSNFDSIKEKFTLVFSSCTPAEMNAQVVLYINNRLTGGMIFTAPWNGSIYVFDYTAPIAREPREGNVYTVTIQGRQQ